MIRTLIIDSESESLEKITIQIKNFCPQIEVLSVCADAQSGINAIKTYKPDLVFLDIEMPEISGLEMLQTYDEIDFGVIFIATSNQFAMDAIKLNAVDYLLKPLDKNDLINAVKKAEEKLNNDKDMERFKAMVGMMEGRQKWKNSNQSQTIALPTFDSIIYEQLENIINIEAQKSYCIFHFYGGATILISKNIGTYEELLSPFDFMRGHRSHIVNLNKVHEFRRIDGGILILKNGKCIDISRNKKEEVLKRLGGIKA